MGCTVRELKSRMTAAEFVEWMGFSLLEPFGGQREDDRARGVMAISLAAAGAKNVEPDKFLPVWTPPVVADPASDMAAFLARMDALTARNEEG